MKRFFRRLLIVLIIAGLAAGGYWWYFKRSAAPNWVFRTDVVKRQELLATIQATGTVEPEEVVDVGAQIAGQIISFGTDIHGKVVDYGSVVDPSTVLASIDDSLYQADVAQASAVLDQSKASLQKAEADIGQMQAKLDQALRDWDRAQKLGPDALAESSYDAYRAAYETAAANMAVGEATVVQAQATMLQSQAALQRVQRNLSYCTIKSPVKGVVIDRRVNIGQTVVASLNAPSLFLIAKDLKRMEIWVQVNEADIGNIHEGQAVAFTVDAYPGEAFVGKVGKVRLNATMTQNVVNYTVEVTTDNSSGKLLPYLTANVRFEVTRREGVLAVPNAALRYIPQTAQIAPAYRDQFEKGMGRRGGQANGASESGKDESTATTRLARPHRSLSASSGPTSRPTSRPAIASAMKRGTIWVREGAFLRPIRVRSGVTDGTMTEVQGQDVTEGMEVVVAEESPGSSAGPQGGANPFAPQFPRGGRRN
jgi:HlyD family secretion protein